MAAHLGPLWRGVPSESTFQRLLRGIDVEHLEELAAQHNLGVAKARKSAGEAGWEAPLLALDLDGKWLRTASAHGSRVPATTNEEGAAPHLLAGLDLRGCRVTMDAGITSRGGHCPMVVKEDTPAWYAELAAIFAVPASRRFDRERAHVATVDKGHGRLEQRDVTLGEDRCAVWKGSAPQTLAALRNMLMAAIRGEDRWESLALAMRWAGAQTVHALQLVGA